MNVRIDESFVRIDQNIQALSLFGLFALSHALHKNEIAIIFFGKFSKKEKGQRIQGIWYFWYSINLTEVGPLAKEKKTTFILVAISLVHVPAVVPQPTSAKSALTR